MLLFRDLSASTPSREQFPANPFLSGLKQGLAGQVRTLVPPQTGWLCSRRRRQAREMERKFLALVTNLFFWRTRESRQQVRVSCSRHCDSGRNESPRELTRDFPAVQGRAEVLGTLAVPSLARQRKSCFIWSFSEALG